MTALNFPSSPTNGQTYSAAGVTWTYSNTYATWNITSSGPTGYVGSQGYSGSQGIIGYTGSKGTDGVIGYNGSNGYNGSQGYTGSGATGVNWTNKSTTYTSVNNDGIIANTSGASFTVKLPASPTTGYYVVFIDGNSSFATNPLTVDGNGGTIATSYTTTTLNITNSKVEFIYNGSTWEIATSTGTRGYSGSVGYTGSLGYTGSQGYTGSASTVIGYTGSKGDIGYTGSIPAALTATSLALGGATLGTNALAVTGTTQLNSALNYGGVTLSNSVTGTGNMVLSASPTLTGTALAASLTFSGTLTGSGSTSGIFLNGPNSDTKNTLNLTNNFMVTDGGFAAFRSGTTHDFNIDVYNSGGNTNAFKIAQTGAVTIPGTLGVTGTLSGAAANFSGNVGIGMTPSNILDITQNQNAGSYLKLLNSNASGSAIAALKANNGTDEVGIYQFGTGFTTSGVYQAHRSAIICDSSAGLCVVGQAGPVIFAAGSTAEKARFDTSGNLLTGCTASWTPPNGQAANYYSPNGMAVGTSTTSSVVYAADRIVYGTTIATFLVLDGNGTGVKLTTSATSWAAQSLRDMKCDFSPITDPRTRIMGLRAELGRYKTDAADAILRPFLFVDDAVENYPWAVGYDKDGNPDSLRMTDFIPLHTAGLQDLYAENEALKASMADLTTRLAALEAK